MFTLCELFYHKYQTTMNINCEKCPEVKNSPGRYKQCGTIVCDQCFSMMDDMICLCCKGRRKCADDILMMSCPCYDGTVEEIDTWESDVDDDHTDESCLDDDIFK